MQQEIDHFWLLMILDFHLELDTESFFDQHQFDASSSDSPCASEKNNAKHQKIAPNINPHPTHRSSTQHPGPGKNILHVVVSDEETMMLNAVGQSQQEPLEFLK